MIRRPDLCLDDRPRLKRPIMQKTVQRRGGFLVAALVVTMVAGACTAPRADPLAAEREAPRAAAVPGGPDAPARRPGTDDLPEEPRRPVTADDICSALAGAAAEYDLPLAFFVRLIWQESRLNPFAVSRAGAQGIAQFMPRTAGWRGLVDPFDPIAALWKSAHYLDELRSNFGNLGLAAAAYNGGSGRVQAWLAGRRADLPGETRAYVTIVTGSPVDSWRRNELPAMPNVIPAEFPCPTITAMTPTVRSASLRRGALPRQGPAEKPWMILLAGNWSEDKALAQYERLQRRFATLLGEREPQVLKRRVAGRGPAPVSLVRVFEETRGSADALCKQLRAGNAGCLVLRNF
jgi:hypothetical protein